MIRMIKGTYGLRKDGTVVAMTKSSGPFSLSGEREAELVAAGVAVTVETLEAEKKYTTDMKMAELRSAAAALGVDVSGARSKKEVIAKLEAAEAEAANATDPEAGSSEE